MGVREDSWEKYEVVDTWESARTRGRNMRLLTRGSPRGLDKCAEGTHPRVLSRGTLVPGGCAAQTTATCHRCWSRVSGATLTSAPAYGTITSSTPFVEVEEPHLFLHYHSLVTPCEPKRCDVIGTHHCLVVPAWPCPSRLSQVLPIRAIVGTDWCSPTTERARIISEC